MRVIMLAELGVAMEMAVLYGHKANPHGTWYQSDAYTML